MSLTSEELSQNYALAVTLIFSSRVCRSLMLGHGDEVLIEARGREWDVVVEEKFQSSPGIV
jgi:hypothetical protein